MAEKKMQAVKTLPKPKFFKDAQVFLGFVNFYRRFIPGFSKIVVPLTLMLKTTISPPADIKKSPKASGNANFSPPEVKLAFSRLR